ncbi:MAG TPA: sigma-70 family RNA polymerase sigma factor [Candidatus Merdenecus merdavium]|nr:sigma-70 family RNA polymerase sigma factor [Candidatus Merdenecus merdavium]
MDITKEEKFDQVYYQYKNLIMKVALDRLHDYHIAQEICQQTFLEYYVHIDRLEERLIKPWLILVTKNATVDYLRKASNRLEFGRKDVELEVTTQVISDYGVERVVDKIIQKELIFKIMDELRIVNENWYEVIMEVTILSKPQEEVAKKLGISIKVLRARLYRAKGWIKKEYGNEYEKL